MMEKEQFVRFDWAMKKLLRNKANSISIWAMARILYSMGRRSSVVFTIKRYCRCRPSSREVQGQCGQRPVSRVFHSEGE